MLHKILILGATGRTAKHAIPFALAKGYKVVALVRCPDKINIQSDHLTIIKGLPTHIDDMRKAMHGCDAVLSMLAPLPHGAAMSIGKIDRPRIMERSIRNALIVMKEYHIKRIMILSTVGAGDSWKYNPWYVKLLAKLTNFKVIFEDHTAQEQEVLKSKTDWTIVRPVGLNEKEAVGELIVTYNQTPKPFQMSRKTLAKFFIDHLYSDIYRHKTPMISEQ